MGMCALVFLDSCSNSCHVIGPSRENSSLQVFSVEYNSLALMPVKQEQTMCKHIRQAHKLKLLQIGISELSVWKFLPVALTVSAAKAQRSPIKCLYCEHSLSRPYATKCSRDCGKAWTFSFNFYKSNHG